MNQANDRGERQVQDLGQEWSAAELRGDTAFLERTLTDDFVGVGPRGFTLTKEQWLNRFLTGDMSYEAHELDDARARVYGDAAVLIARLTQRAAYRGQDSSGRFRASLVCVRQDGAWRLAGLQLSPLAEGGPPSS